MQASEAKQALGDLVKGLKVRARLLVTELQPPTVPQTGKRLLHHIPLAAEAAAVFRRPSRRQPRTNPPGAHLANDARKPVTPVTIERANASSRPAASALDRRQQLQHLQERLLIPDVRRCRQHQQRYAVAIHDQMAFTAVLRPINGVRSGVAPPKTARTDAESTTASDGSTALSCASRFSSWWCSFFQIPASVQIWKRLQHVEPLTPNASCGSICHEIPLRSTKRMPRRQSRSDANGRPPLRCGGCRGNSGSTSCHNASGKSSFDTVSPLPIRSLQNPYRKKRGL